MRTTLGLAVVALASLAAASPALEEMWRLPLGLGQGVLVAGPDAMYTTDTRGAVFAIGAANGTLRWSWPGSSNVSAMALSPDGSRLLVGVLPTTVIAFDAVTGAVLWRQDNIPSFGVIPAGNNVTVDVFVGSLTARRNGVLVSSGGGAGGWPGLAVLRLSDGAALWGHHSSTASSAVLVGPAASDRYWAYAVDSLSPAGTSLVHLFTVYDMEGLTAVLNSTSRPYPDNHTLCFGCNNINIANNLLIHTLLPIPEPNVTVHEVFGVYALHDVAGAPGGATKIPHPSTNPNSKLNFVTVSLGMAFEAIQEQPPHNLTWKYAKLAPNAANTALETQWSWESPPCQNPYAPNFIVMTTTPFQRLSPPTAAGDADVVVVYVSSAANVTHWPNSTAPRQGSGGVPALLALNASTGQQLWSMPGFAAPLGPTPGREISGLTVNVENTFVHPLGGGLLFVPNLQGYTLVAGTSGGGTGEPTVVERNLHQPLMNVASFQTPNGHGGHTPFVVFQDIAAGALVAVKKRSG